MGGIDSNRYRDRMVLLLGPDVRCAWCGTPIGKHDAETLEFHDDKAADEDCA